MTKDSGSHEPSAVDGTRETHLDRVEGWFGTRSRQWAESYQTVRRVNDIVLIDRKSITREFVRRYVPQGGIVLDAGCGAGAAALDLVQSGYRVHGVDIAQEMIDQSERLFADAGAPRDKYEFTRTDVLSADLAPGSFDAVIALGLLQYQIEQEPLLERFRDVLRPGGVLVVTGPIRRGLPNYLGAAEMVGLLLRRLGVMAAIPTEGRTQHRYDLDGFRRLLERAGFDVLDARGHGFGDWVGLGRVIGFRGELLLHRLLTQAAASTGVGRWGNDLVLAARVPENASTP